MRDPTEYIKNVFKIYKNIFNKVKRSIKINYYDDTTQETENNIWKIDNIIGKQNDKSYFPAEFVIEGHLFTNKSNIAESFNDYVSKIVLKSSQNVPSTSIKQIAYLPNTILHIMLIDPATLYDMIYTASKLKSKMNYGHVEISLKWLKQIINHIIDPINHIFNRSFFTGIVPDQIAKVIQMFLTSDQSSINNYCPVWPHSLEKPMYYKALSFLKLKDVIYKHQYGFRAKHCTVHSIIYFLDHCADTNNKNNPEYTLAVFWDLSKAFDVINRNIVLHKLKNYGIRRVVLS